MTSLLQIVRSRALVFLMLGHFSNDMLGGVLPVLFPTMKLQYGLTNAQLGLVTLAFTATSSLTQPLFGYFSDTHGRRWFVPATLIWGALCAACYGFITSYLAFIALAASFHKGRLKLWLRQPQSIAIALWATAHLLANGKVAAVLFFSGFLVLAIIDIAVSTARGDVPNYVPKPSHDIIAVVAGLILYGIFLFLFHPLVLNVPIV